MTRYRVVRCSHSNPAARWPLGSPASAGAVELSTLVRFADDFATGMVRPSPHGGHSSRRALAVHAPDDLAERVRLRAFNVSVLMQRVTAASLRCASLPAMRRGPLRAIWHMRN
jgi:hypothetical protein